LDIFGTQGLNFGLQFLNFSLRTDSHILMPKAGF
jgi:hypothetical protein